MLCVTYLQYDTIFVAFIICLIVLLFQQQDSDNIWWDAFATEFFEDDATLTLSFCLEDGPKRYSKCQYLITRSLAVETGFLNGFSQQSDL